MRRGFPERYGGQKEGAAKRKYDDAIRARLKWRYLTLRVLNYDPLEHVLSRLVAEFGLERHTVHHLLEQEQVK